MHPYFEQCKFSQSIFVSSFPNISCFNFFCKELYIAVGISGAIQHLAGMKDSKVCFNRLKELLFCVFKTVFYAQCILSGKSHQLHTYLTTRLQSNKVNSVLHFSITILWDYNFCRVLLCIELDHKLKSSLKNAKTVNHYVFYFVADYRCNQ